MSCLGPELVASVGRAFIRIALVACIVIVAIALGAILT